jgi:hypothetical protein
VDVDLADEHDDDAVGDFMDLGPEDAVDERAMDRDQR